MPYRPTFPYPHLNTIDVDDSDGNNFRCLINDKDNIVGYTLTIYKNSDSSTICTIKGSIISNSLKKEIALGTSAIFTTITSTTEETLPIQGGMGKDSYLVVNVPKNVQIESVTNKICDNGTDYKWTIELTDSNSLSVLSREFFFKARSTPNVAISEFTTNIGIDGYLYIDTSNMTFNATYSQDENVSITYHKFDLYLNNELIDTTGEVYSSYLTYTYDSFLSNKNNIYTIAFTVMADGIKAVAQTDFKVIYDTAAPIISPEMSVDNYKTAINVDFSKIMKIPGKPSDVKDVAYNFTTANDTVVLQLNKSHYIYWDENEGVGDLEIPDDFTLLLNTNLDFGFNGIICELEDIFGYKYQIGYNGNEFYYKIGDQDTVAHDIYTSTASGIVATGTTPETDVLYVFNEEDYWYEDKIIIGNDMGNQYWWKITALPNEVRFYKYSLPQQEE